MNHHPSPDTNHPAETRQPTHKASATGFSPLQLFLKRIIDISLSIATIIITSPLIIILAIIIKSSGKGDVLFRQERVGKNGKPFTLLKFRTMYEGAEPEGPMLSNPADPRVTPAGKFMRRHKIDELPNFLNVIKGDMSVVGPRPEREYYLSQLRSINPEVDMLLTVKPGVTCTGQVKYGYASDLNQMTERLPYELEYVRSLSLRNDFVIMWQTVLLLIRGREK